MTRDEARSKLLESKLAEDAAAAPHDMAAYARLVHTDDAGNRLVPAPHHLRWIELLQSDAPEDRWLVIVAGTGYAKSTWCSVVWPAWQLGRSGGRDRIGLVSNTWTQAMGFANAVRGAIEHPNYQLAFPSVRPAPEVGWTQQQLWLTGSSDRANPNLMAAGMKGPVQGKRFDKIVLDDPTTYDDVRSAGVMRSQRARVKSVLMRRFPAGMGPPAGGGRCIVPCTRWGTGDLVPMLVDELGFNLHVFPALGYWDRQWDAAAEEYNWGNKALWPEHESEEQLQRLREADPIMFELVYQGNASAGSGGTHFQPENFQVGLRPPREAYKRMVAFVDTASGKDQAKGDYTAMVMLGQMPDETLWIHHVYRARLTAPQQVQMVLREYMAHSPDMVYIEDVGEGTALYQQLRATASHIPTDAVKVSKDKGYRAAPLAQQYAQRRVWHPGAPDRDGNLRRLPWVPGYEMELVAFDGGMQAEHDDQVDAAAGAFTALAKRGARVTIMSRG